MRMEMTGRWEGAKRTFHRTLGNPKKRDSHISILTAADSQTSNDRFQVTLTQDEKCQPCARSKVSTIPPAAQFISSLRLRSLENLLLCQDGRRGLWPKSSEWHLST